IMWVVLIGQNIRGPAAPNHLRKNLGAVTHEPDGERTLFITRCGYEFPCFVEVAAHSIEVPCCDSSLNPRRIDFDAEKSRAVHRCSERLGATHAAKTARHEYPSAQ